MPLCQGLVQLHYPGQGRPVLGWGPGAGVLLALPPEALGFLFLVGPCIRRAGPDHGPPFVPFFLALGVLSPVVPVVMVGAALCFGVLPLPLALLSEADQLPSYSVYLGHWRTSLSLPWPSVV